MRRPFALAAALLASACASGGSSAPAPAAAAPSRMPAGDPASLAYSPGPSRYRVESRTTSHTEAMGQVTDVEATTTMLISAVIAPSGANLEAAITIDSITVQSTGPMQGQLDPTIARGRTFRVTMTPQGRALGIVVPDSANPAMRQVGSEMRDFLPMLPPSPITAGQTWTDTVTENQNLGEIQLSSRSIRQNRVVGWEAREGARALKITTNGAYTVSGTGNAQGQELRLEGQGTATLERFVSAGGVFLAQTGLDSGTVNVTVTAFGLEIPVRRTSRTTITRVP